MPRDHFPALRLKCHMPDCGRPMATSYTRHRPTCRECYERAQARQMRESISSTRPMVIRPFVLAILLFGSSALGQQYCPPGVNCPQPQYGYGQQQAAPSIGHIASFHQSYQWVCRITGYDGGGYSTGTGSLVYEDARLGYVLTAKHVIRGVSGQIVCHFPNGRKMAARVHEVHPTADLALLVIQPTGIKTPKIRQDEPTDREKLWAGGYGGDGHFRSVAGQASYRYQQQLSIVGCRVRQGDSGGPIIDSQGRFVAVLWGTGSNDVMACRWTPVRNILRGVWDRLRRPNVTIINNQQQQLGIGLTQPAAPVPDPPEGEMVPVEPDTGEDLDDGTPSVTQGPPGPRGPAGPAGPPGPPGDPADVDTEQIATRAAEIVLAGMQHIYVRRDELLEEIPPLHVRFEDDQGNSRDEVYYLGRDKMVIKVKGLDVKGSTRAGAN